jgi:hypothetical protein
MTPALQNVSPENRRFFSEQFQIAEAGKEAVKPLRLAVFQEDAIIESIVVEAYDAYMIPDPANPGQFIPDRTRAITKNREDKDRILVVMERTNNESLVISTGSSNTRAIDMFAFNELFQIGQNGGWKFPKGTELQFRIRHQFTGNKPSCGIPIFGTVTVSLFYDIFS